MVVLKMTELKRSVVLFLLLSNWNLILSEKRYGMFVNLGANGGSNLMCAQKCLAKEGCTYAANGGEKGGCRFSNKPIPGVPNGQVMRDGFYADCLDAKHRGVSQNSIVLIMLPIFPNTIKGYCDMQTGEGGWLVIQRRLNGLVSFDRLWKDYVNGFGEIKSDYWIGLKNLHSLTSGRRFKLRIDIVNESGDSGYAEYYSFEVSSADDFYRLTANGYSGNIGDGLADSSKPTLIANNQRFSTSDKDNDGSPMVPCAMLKSGGWWFNKCLYGHLNGRFGISIGDDRHMSWFPWKNRYGDIKFVEMKIGPSE